MIKTIITKAIADAAIEMMEGDERIQEIFQDAITVVMTDQGFDFENDATWETAMEALQRISLRVAG